MLINSVTEQLTGMFVKVPLFTSHTHAITIIGSPTIGESFDPARDCSDIVDNLPEAKDGFYWIALDKNKAQKVGHR